MTHDDSTPDNLDLSIYLSHCTINSHIHTGTVQAITFFFAMEKVG